MRSVAPFLYHIICFLNCPVMEIMKEGNGQQSLNH